jgi:rhodanese-related sulfurtransferase
MKTENTLQMIAVAGLVILASWGIWKWYGSKNQPSGIKVATQQVVEAPQGKLIVVNVLDKKLYDDAHIKGSIHVDYTDLSKEAQKWNKDATVVVYCADYLCGASASGAQQLAALGFKDVRAYEGGMAEWHQLHQKDASYELEGPAKMEYLSVVSKKQNVPHGSAQVKEISAQELRDLLKNSAQQ